MRTLLLTAIAAGVLVVLVGACATEAPPTTAPESQVGLPNPASQYCVDQGYELEIRSEEDGEVGYCIFPDGTECEEWAYYRGECEPGTPKP